MPIVPLSRLLTHASQNLYAVGAFVSMNLEVAQAAIAAGEAQQSPVVVRIHPNLRATTAFSTMTAAVRQVASQAAVPVGISLDHGETIADTIDAVRAGATSVMLDAAEEPLDENIRRVREVVTAVSGLGIMVEAAIGHMEHGAVQGDADFASVAEAVRLVKESGATILAPAVGNVHGVAHGGNKEQSSLNIDRIRALCEATGVPICLHGGSRTPRAMMQEGIDAGIALVILFTDIIGPFNDELRRVLAENPGAIDIIHALEPAQKAAQAVIEVKMEDLRSAGKAAAFADWDRAQA